MIKTKKATPGRMAIRKNDDRGKDNKSFRYSKPEAVKMLEQLADEAARLKYPGTPPQWLAPRKYRDDSANGLTKCIIHFLTLKGWQAERINSTGRPIDRRMTYTDVLGRSRTIGSMKWIKGTGTAGTADISATIAGRAVKIEVKIGADRQSQAQIDYQRQVEAAGGIYVIARDFSGFYQWYNQTFEV